MCPVFLNTACFLVQSLHKDCQNEEEFPNKDGIVVLQPEHTGTVSVKIDVRLEMHKESANLPKTGNNEACLDQQPQRYAQLDSSTCFQGGLSQLHNSKVQEAT